MAYECIDEPPIIPNTSKEDFIALLANHPDESDLAYEYGLDINSFWNHPVFGGSVLNSVKAATTGVGGAREP